MNANAKPLLAIIALIYAQCSFAQTLFTYGNNAVSRHEFELAFDKNNTNGTHDERSYRNYLELYTRYKLKVQAAYDQKFDTLLSQKAELQNFRSQIADNYLTDDEAVQSLVDEAYERSRKDIHLAHIFIKFNSITDTAEAYKKATEAYTQLQEGKSFANVAALYSGDPNVGVNKGDIGYITVFTLPYNLETLVYSLKPGTFSKPYKGKSGYHIFKNIDERKAVGTISVAQILLAFPANATSVQKSVVDQKADSIYAAAVLGRSSFESLALQNSNDNLSYKAGGQLPEFGVGKYEPAFENAAFALAKDGDVSKPVETSYGYHIIKRLSLKTIPETKTPEYMAELKQKVISDTRMQVASATMMKKILTQIQYKKAAVNQNHLWAFADSALNEKRLPKFNDLNSKTVLFSFAKRKFTANEWANYLQAIHNVGELVNGKSKADLLQQFVETSAGEYYRDHLEDYNKAFAAQLEEFKNGNLLFECMQKHVWAKASDDTAGLKKYYTNNANRYWWQPGADAVLFSSNDQNSINELYKKIAENKAAWRTLAKPYENIVQADSGRYEYNQFPVNNADKLSEGFITPPVKDAKENLYTFLYIIKKYPEKTHRNFDDAKGFTLNDYQNYLEEEWIIQLKKKYPVKVNDTVLQTLWTHR